MNEKYESSNHDAENMLGNEWDKLSELSSEEMTLASGIINKQDIVSESPEDKQRKLSQAAAQVKAAYEKNNLAASAPAQTEVAKVAFSPSEQLSPTGRKNLSKYDATERPRVDRIKSNLNIFNLSEYESKQITSKPSAITKMARLIADRLGIRTKKSDERREREAIHVALSEYYEEEAAKRRAMEEMRKAEALEMERKRVEYETEMARIEENALARDMATARDAFEYNKHDEFRKQRIQEAVERDLNSRLLTIDNLETEVILENPEVQKRLVSFDGTDIPIYDLKGYPFSLLSTTIDYRSANKPGEIGTETSRRILDNPAIWAERRDEAEKASGFGTRNANARGDTISTSYWNSERNIDSHVPGNLIYGFEKVQADSIISISNGDGGTSNMAGGAKTTLNSPDALRQLEGATGTGNYNEILLRRYTENGIPKKPDYIITENGRITEESLRHAKYYGIPIVNVERSIYAEKAERRGRELLASISETDTYEEMDEKIAELLSMSSYKWTFRTLDGIGRGSDMPSRMGFTPLEERCLEVSQMELHKRLDFIKKTLEDATRSITSATDRGLLVERNIPGFDYFDIDIRDVQKQLRRTEYGDENDSFYTAPGNCNMIDIGFRIKGSSRDVKTSVYDGERMYRAEEALAKNIRTREDVENADSSFYDALEPVVLDYFKAFRKNYELRKSESQTAPNQ